MFEKLSRPEERLAIHARSIFVNANYIKKSRKMRVRCWQFDSFAFLNSNKVTKRLMNSWKSISQQSIVESLGIKREIQRNQVFSQRFGENELNQLVVVKREKEDKFR